MMIDNKTDCTDHYQLDVLAFLPLPIVGFALNFLLFMTTTLNRKRLERQNYVYICVISTLLSNVFFILLQVWFSFDTYLTMSNRSEERTKVIWTLCQASIVSIQCCMAGNIGSLLFVLLDSTYFVGRSVNRKASDFVKDCKPDGDQNGRQRLFLKAKRRRAIILIGWSWILPISLVIAATAKWNCDHDCQFCSHGFSADLHCRNGSWCSRIWSPLRNDFLSLHAALWVFEVLGLISIIVSGIRSFRQVMAPPRRGSADSLDPNSEESKAEERSMKLSKGESRTSINTSANNNQQIVVNGSPNSSTRDKVLGTGISARGRQRRPSHVRLHSRISFMIALSVTFFLCTLPSFITYILDITGTPVHSEAAMSISFTAVYFYVIACPIILLKFLPNLQSALMTMIRNCSITRFPPLQRRHSTNKIVRQP